MTVGNLIAALAAYPTDSVVVTEFCDMDGDEMGQFHAVESLHSIGGLLELRFGNPLPHAVEEEEEEEDLAV